MKYEEDEIREARESLKEKLTKGNFKVRDRKKKPFDKMQAIEETLIMMRILWNKHGYEKFRQRVDLRLDKEKYIIRGKDDFKNIIRVFQFILDMKRAPRIRFILKPK